MEVESVVHSSLKEETFVAFRGLGLMLLAGARLGVLDVFMVGLGTVRRPVCRSG